MSAPSSDNFSVPNEPEYLYTVLNLPTTASGYEIRERYRQLSVLFHPDKQHDDHTKDAAGKRFLEVQKAYQVLSDPILRQIYDHLGLDGLSKAPEDLATLSPEEREKVLAERKLEMETQHIREIVRSEGRVSVAIDASLPEDYEDEALHRRLIARIRSINLTKIGIRHSVEKPINDKTTVVISGRSSFGLLNGRTRSRASTATIIGTVRHQFSPRLSFEATANLILSSLGLRSTYSDKNNTVNLETNLHWSRPPNNPQEGLPSLLPPTTISVSRRLFRDSPAAASVTFTTGPTPVYMLGFTSQREFDLSSLDNAASGSNSASSYFHVTRGARYWTAQLIVAGINPGMRAEWGLNFVNLGLQVQTAVQAHLIGGLSFLFGGEWKGEATAVAANVDVGTNGVVLKTSFAYYGQRFYFPIRFSEELDATVAMWAAALPCATYIFSYIFFIKPRMQRLRKRFFDHAREQLRDEKSDAVRESKETIALLVETANRHMQTETARDGLVILEATYGPAEQDGDTEGLDVDVTIPIQALVNKGQLYIPGRRSKAGLQGFYDPIPGITKILRIRYMFGGHVHYAEIADLMPVVIPLEDHLVE